MTKKTAQLNGWTIGRATACTIRGTRIGRKWFARKGQKYHLAPTLKVLLAKLVDINEPSAH